MVFAKGEKGMAYSDYKIENLNGRERRNANDLFGRECKNKEYGST